MESDLSCQSGLRGTLVTKCYFSLLRLINCTNKSLPNNSLIVKVDIAQSVEEDHGETLILIIIYCLLNSSPCFTTDLFEHSWSFGNLLSRAPPFPKEGMCKCVRDFRKAAF